MAGKRYQEESDAPKLHWQTGIPPSAGWLCNLGPSEHSALLPATSKTTVAYSFFTGRPKLATSVYFHTLPTSLLLAAVTSTVSSVAGTMYSSAG